MSFRRPDTIVRGWMNSPGNGKEILTGHWREMGIGIAYAPDGKDTFSCVVLAQSGIK